MVEMFLGHDSWASLKHEPWAMSLEPCAMNHWWSVIINELFYFKTAKTKKKWEVFKNIIFQIRCHLSNFQHAHLRNFKFSKEHKFYRLNYFEVSRFRNVKISHIMGRIFSKLFDVWDVEIPKIGVPEVDSGTSWIAGVILHGAKVKQLAVHATNQPRMQIISRRCH